MTYNVTGKRIRSENLAGQVTTTAWDYFDCTPVGELNSAAKNARSAEHAYDFDDIGNRETSSERGTNSVYTANQLNQYTAVDDFRPQFDDDGNQTLIKTSTGVWQVQYNGENRPILWENVSTNSPTPNSSTPTLILMSYDRMGRRVTKNDQRFVYNGYLQIANFELQTSNIKLQTFIWDPTESVATRPLAWIHENSAAYYTHDGNKNVSEVVSSENAISAHYEHAPFGSVLVMQGECALDNPWSFSSEYAEDDSATIYYNYRHYEPVAGRWLRSDVIDGIVLYIAFRNEPISNHDYGGLIDDRTGGNKQCSSKKPSLFEWEVMKFNNGRLGINKDKWERPLMDDYEIVRDLGDVGTTKR